MQPFRFFRRIGARLRVAGQQAIRAGSARTDHAEAGVVQHVEGLLEEHVFEEEAGSVAVVAAPVRVAAFVQRFSEHFPTQRDASGDQDAKQFPEFNVGDPPVAAERKRSPISDRNAAGFVLPSDAQPAGRNSFDRVVRRRE